ncbi:hypothetical protein C8Q75DRAFT_757980 [Abortiporus biennis]|nr:hypothetical protein C8Q75DRAFT_757980 [Abortiporus biennis]
MAMPVKQAATTPTKHSNNRPMKSPKPTHTAITQAARPTNSKQLTTSPMNTRISLNRTVSMNPGHL